MRRRLFYRFLPLVLLLIASSGCSNRKRQAGRDFHESGKPFRAPSEAELRGVYANPQNNKHCTPCRERSIAGQEAQEARFTDIPIPFMAKRRGYQWQDHGELGLYYDVAQPVHAMCDWICYQMERNGWQQQIAFIGDEVLLVFDKPSRLCAITIERKGKKSSSLTIISSTKVR